MKVRIKEEFGQFYACAYGREVKALLGKWNLWFWQPALVGMGFTPGRALTDLGKLLKSLEDPELQREIEEVKDEIRARTKSST